MPAEGLSGTQARQLFPARVESTRPKVKRIDPRLMGEAADLRVGDVEVLVRELRRVVAALDEYGGFEDD